MFGAFFFFIFNIQNSSVDEEVYFICDMSFYLGLPMEQCRLKPRLFQDLIFSPSTCIFIFFSDL